MPKVIETEATPTMSQRSFASAEFALKKKRTRREKFLAEMERVVPWARLIAVIEPRAVAAEAHLEGERKAKGALEAQVSALQGGVKPAQADAARATAAEASNAGLHAQISLLNLTIATFRELLKEAGHGKEAGDGAGRSSAPLRMGAAEAAAVD